MKTSEWKIRAGGELQRRMKEKGYNQYDLAYKSGVAQSTISGFINSKKSVNIITAIKLVHALGCSLDDLFNFGEAIK